jgi:hypothetical protein
MDLVPEHHLTRSCGVHDLECQRQPDESFRGQALISMARYAGDSASGVVVARGAIPWCTNACRAVVGAGAVTAAAREGLVTLVFKVSAHEARGGGAVLERNRVDHSIRKTRSGARRQDDGEHRSNQTLCDADSGAKTDATAHSGGLVGYFTFTAGGGIICGRVEIAATDWRP